MTNVGGFDERHKSREGEITVQWATPVNADTVNKEDMLTMPTFSFTNNNINMISLIMHKISCQQIA
jgi:hypothetical protein